MKKLSQISIFGLALLKNLFIVKVVNQNLTVAPKVIYIGVVVVPTNNVHFSSGQILRVTSLVIVHL